MSMQDHKELAKEYREGKHSFKHPKNAVKFAEMHESKSKGHKEEALEKAREPRHLHITHKTGAGQYKGDTNERDVRINGKFPTKLYRK